VDNLGKPLDLTRHLTAYKRLKSDSGFGYAQPPGFGFAQSPVFCFTQPSDFG
jgi:hypothetical protein